MSAGTAAALIGNGASAQQIIKRGTLAALPDIARRHAFVAPTLIVIGEVVELFAGHTVAYPGRFSAAMPFREVSCA